MKPMLDPKRDLKGATPETLARALLKPLRRPRTRTETVLSYKAPVQEGSGQPVPRRCAASAQAFLSSACCACP